MNPGTHTTKTFDDMFDDDGGDNDDYNDHDINYVS
jgi:hypothetical protein